MQYIEFLTTLKELKPGEKIYFKPITPEDLNAYDPSIKNRIFEISTTDNESFKVRFITIMQEIIFTKPKLEDIFDNKNWQNFKQFDLVEDFNAWTKK